ncbi:signal recognition particle receptor subunit alpha [bacterium endosymbiont of Pedicinus badii]|uniref:signal recognition particle receptor subunit alpha n=1 Tax=bacterium endosymbiont of Pedicinus badii TaxID=1719126 RepID=UPI0009BBD6F5|nr:signal recognition particle receptor subunit alpha [bacterium endosymbiont of Pedicinus badii]OQM34249.1 hypothetical protein AOQ89_02875 [bacterium endosymbiont of Pedicinus badii]
MFKSLSKRISSIKNKILGLGILTEKNIQSFLKNIENALIESDVNTRIVREIIKKFSKKIKKIDINSSFDPGKKFINLLYKEIIKFLDHKNRSICFSKEISIFFVIGSPGSGKTSTLGKLAYLLKKKERILLFSIDQTRSSSELQLQIIAKNANVGFLKNNFLFCVKNLNKIYEFSLLYAKKNKYKILLIDTPGILKDSFEIIENTKKILSLYNPIENFLILDSSYGQDSVNLARFFKKHFQITGIILTKIDSDTKGGAALSMTKIINKPIKFITNGESLKKLQKFNPKTIAKRILNLEDNDYFFKEIKKNLNFKENKKFENKNFLKVFDLEIMLKEMKKIRKISRFGIIDFFFKKEKYSNNKEEMIQDYIKKLESIINSMNKNERKYPEKIKKSRKRSIAYGSGTKIQDVNVVLRQFFEMKKLNQKMQKNRSFMSIKNLRNFLSNKI